MGGFSTFSLAPYSGEWTIVHAAHLLRRTTYGSTPDDINLVAQMGMESAMEQLLSDAPLPALPINYRNPDDTVAIGDAWVNQPYDRSIQNQIGERLRSLNAWTIGNMLGEGLSIREKMVLFWHNHFVTSDIRDASYVYKNVTLYRTHFLGNFRSLTKETTIDPAMLIYLNGRQNSNQQPNENYARELLELFTIGKGPQVGEGDYTNYTEQDVAAIARVLTGWRDIGFYSRNGEEPTAAFIPFRHDTGTKTLSHRFDNIEIEDMGEEEYAHLIDIIFTKDEVARFIARKIYRWFVYYEISSEVEAGVIQPMADILIAADYEMYPMVKALLSSTHFYDAYAQGAMIKNPLDFTISLFKELRIDLGTEILEQYGWWNRIARLPFLLEMRYYDPPTVAGWKAYYQEPLYYRSWINSSTLSFRYVINQTLINGVRVGDRTLSANLLDLVADIEDAIDPNKLIEGIASYILPGGITEEQLQDLKSALIPGLPDYEWTVEYEEFLSDPSNSELKGSIENRLRAVMNGFVSMPEYQLS
ncbi:MAG: DUF1800 domain-containing protein [Saprospiraceae bacterium]|nr:DUF1800 domain-containing protein [Saprospiraceae bacterium]